MYAKNPNTRGGNYPNLGRTREKAGTSDFDPKWVRLAPNGTNSGLLPIIFQYILALSSNNTLTSD